MGCRITELVLDCRDPSALASFWCAVLDFQVVESEPDSVAIGGEDSPITLVFSRSADPRRGKLPLHIDVNAVRISQEDELARLLALGARPADIGQTGEESWHVLQDPEGNEFCLLRSSLPA